MLSLHFIYCNFQPHAMSQPGHDTIDPKLASRLPLDLVLCIISHIDSSTAEGKRTLAACARLSRACRSTAENALYRHAVFDSTRLTTFLLDLVGRGNDHSAHVRAKRLVGHIEWLQLRDRPVIPAIPVSLIWEAASILPGIPLFPRVRHLSIVPSLEAYRVSHPLSLLRPPLAEIPAGILVFDTIDVCAIGWPACGLLSYLPTRHVSSFTAHDMAWEWIEDILVPEWAPCGSLCVFDRSPADVSWSSFQVRRLEAKARSLDVPPLRIMVCGIKWESESLESLAQVRDWEHSAAWGPVSPWLQSSENKIQLAWYDRDDCSCPACIVCGR